MLSAKRNSTVLQVAWCCVVGVLICQLCWGDDRLEEESLLSRPSEVWNWTAIVANLGGLESVGHHLGYVSPPVQPAGLQPYREIQSPLVCERKCVTRCQNGGRSGYMGGIYGCFGYCDCTYKSGSYSTNQNHI